MYRGLAGPFFELASIRLTRLLESGHRFLQQRNARCSRQDERIESLRHRAGQPAHAVTGDDYRRDAVNLRIALEEQHATAFARERCAVAPCYRFVNRTAEDEHRRVLRRVLCEPLAVHRLRLRLVLGQQQSQPRPGLARKGKDALRRRIVVAVVAQSVGRRHQRHRGQPRQPFVPSRRPIIIAAACRQSQHAAERDDVIP